MSMPNKDKRAKYINVPIANFDEMEFIFQDKHVTREFTVLQTPYDRVHARGKDFIGDTEKNAGDVEVDHATHYDPDCLPDDTNNESLSSKCPRGDKRDKDLRFCLDGNRFCLHLAGGMPVVTFFAAV
ncbi:hypothetical protein D1007_41491 [Hordeum vulgare]|nr:hypothetical protein D1007_41491 [Hordeum vulgare]